MNNTVVIHIRGGVAYCTRKDFGIHLEILDYDDEYSDRDFGIESDKDSNGEPCNAFVSPAAEEIKP